MKLILSSSTFCNDVIALAVNGSLGGVILRPFEPRPRVCRPSADSLLGSALSRDGMIPPLSALLTLGGGPHIDNDLVFANDGAFVFPRIELEASLVFLMICWSPKSGRPL